MRLHERTLYRVALMLLIATLGLLTSYCIELQNRIAQQQNAITALNKLNVSVMRQRDARDVQELERTNVIWRARAIDLYRKSHRQAEDQAQQDKTIAHLRKVKDEMEDEAAAMRKRLGIKEEE